MDVHTSKMMYLTCTNRKSHIIIRKVPIIIKPIGMYYTILYVRQYKFLIRSPQNIIEYIYTHFKPQVRVVCMQNIPCFVFYISIVRNELFYGLNYISYLILKHLFLRLNITTNFKTLFFYFFFIYLNIRWYLIWNVSML